MTSEMEVGTGKAIVLMVLRSSPRNSVSDISGVTGPGHRISQYRHNELFLGCLLGRESVSTYQTVSIQSPPIIRAPTIRHNFSSLIPVPLQASLEVDKLFCNGSRVRGPRVWWLFKYYRVA